MVTTGLVIVVAVALAFDFFNGFHDAANSIATVVATRVLTPVLAVLWAAFFNFVAFLVFGTKVAATIAKDVVKPDVLSLSVVFCGLLGAIAWDLITWYLGPRWPRPDGGPCWTPASARSRCSSCCRPSSDWCSATRCWSS